MYCFLTYKQILTQEHDKAVLSIIRANVEDYDELNSPEDEDDDDDEEDDDKVQQQHHTRRKCSTGSPLKIGDHLVLGSSQKSTSIADLAASDLAFSELNIHLTNCLRHMAVKTPNGQDIKIRPNDKVCTVM